MAKTPDSAIQAAEALAKQGRLDEAVAGYEAALRHWPDQPALLYNMGNVHLQRADPSAAAIAFSRVTELVPHFAWAHHNLAQALMKSRHEARAQPSFERALALDPALTVSRIELAKLLQRTSRVAQAQLLLEAGLKLQPTSAALYLELGILLGAAGRVDSAQAAYRQALALEPASFAAHHNLGASLYAEGLTDAALPLAQRAVALRPQSHVGHEGLGNILGHQGELAAARATYATARRLKPPDARLNLGVELRAALLLPPVVSSRAHIEQVRQEMADHIETHRHSLGSLVDPAIEVGMASTFYLAYHGLNNRSLLSSLASMYRELCPALEYTAGWLQDDAPHANGPLRVGIVSTYLRHHTIGRYLLGMVKHLSRPEFQVCLYTWGPAQDDVAQAFRASADEVHLMPGSLCEAQKVLGDGKLDVLLYADIGMEPITYFLAFSRFAPVQCAFFGHPDTTGLATIDHYISWSLAETPQSHDWYSEPLALLPPTVTYAHLPRVLTEGQLASRRSLGLPESARLYLCVQSPYKLHPDFDDLLAGILSQDGAARIALVEGPVRAWTAALRQRLSTRLGAELDRVHFLPARPYPDYLALLAAADVVLDTPHFSGGATTLDAIAVGTPVISRPGPTLRSGQTAALYARMGLADEARGVCRSDEAYARLAVAIATDRDRRMELREQLLERGKVLIEDPGMVRELEGWFRRWVTQAAGGR